MHKTLKILLFLFPLVGLGQNVHIPDIVFKNYLINNKNINLNQDSEIQLTEATAYTKKIVVFGLDIDDLSGIESFNNLTYLDCSHTKLTHLDLSKNTKLVRLYAYNIYNLKDINVSKCLDLKDFWCNNNDLTSLNVSENSKLEFLQCDGNNLINLNLSQNPKLRLLRCQGNNLNHLDLRNGNLQIMSTRIFKVYNKNLNCILVDNPNWASENLALPYHTNFSSNCLSVDKIITENKAIRQAKKFLKEQGYTKYTNIDSLKLKLENQEYNIDRKVILENRYNKYTLTPSKVELVKNVLWEVTFPSIDKKEEITVLINSHKNLILVKPRMDKIEITESIIDY